MFMAYETFRYVIDNKLYLNETYYYQQFPTPTYVFDNNTIYLKYAYNEGLKVYKS